MWTLKDWFLQMISTEGSSDLERLQYQYDAKTDKEIDAYARSQAVR